MLKAWFFLHLITLFLHIKKKTNQCPPSHRSLVLYCVSSLLLILLVRRAPLQAYPQALSRGRASSV